MRHIGSVLLCAVALIFCGSAAAQEKYDNSSLDRLGSGLGKSEARVYTNADLARLQPLKAQAAPVSAVEVNVAGWLADEQARGSERRALEFYRDRMRAELDYEMARIDAAYSVGGGDFTGSLRQGLKSKLEGRLNALHRELYLIDWQIARLEGRDLPPPDLRR